MFPVAAPQHSACVVEASAKQHKFQLHKVIFGRNKKFSRKIIWEKDGIPVHPLAFKVLGSPVKSEDGRKTAYEVCPACRGVASGRGVVGRPPRGRSSGQRVGVAVGDAVASDMSSPPIRSCPTLVLLGGTGLTCGPRGTDGGGLTSPTPFATGPSPGP